MRASLREKFPKALLRSLGSHDDANEASKEEYEEKQKELEGIAK